MDYNQQRQVRAGAQRVGESALIIFVRIATDVLKFLWKFIVDMGKSIVGK